MPKYENLYNFILNKIIGRYDVDDDLLKIKLIKYLAYYISGRDGIDDYVFSLADDIFFDLLNNPIGKKINKKIRVIGLGGVSGNFLIYILAKAIYFDDIVFYESRDERIELSNALRYLVFNPFGEISKVDFFKKLCFLFGRDDIKIVAKKYIAKNDDNYIIFGTPDISTRQEIVKLSLKYVFLFHQDSSFYLFTNLSKKFSEYVISGVPISEGYGRIKYSLFINNLIKYISNVLEVIENAN